MPKVLKEDYKIENLVIQGCEYGDITIPKGTRVTSKTATGVDENYNFVDEFGWYKPELTGYARTMSLHDFVHYGINVPKEYVEIV